MSWFASARVALRRKRLAIGRTVASADGMHAGDPEHYWRWGEWSLQRVQATIGDRPVRRLLDLPCGHGRALRWFRAAYPDAAITACDLDEEGVAFCAATFPGVTGVVSNEDPSAVELEGSYDVIWVGSLLTHLDADRWPAFLELFRGNLAPDGTLIFTTHGSCMAQALSKKGLSLGLDEADRRRVLADWVSTGFGYADYAGDGQYGISLSSTQWVKDLLSEMPGLELVEHVRRGWGSRWYHHETWACRREP